MTPTVIGGPITTWSITPSLPSGLSFSTSNGAISGTPTAISTSTAYTVTATNSGGSDTATVTITVSEPLPVIAYSPNSFTLAVGTAMTAVSPPTLYGTGTVDSYSITPTLPSGLSIDASNGTVSGTPSAVSPSRQYTITATNTAGSDTATITILVNGVAPSSITYSPSSFSLTKGTPMTTTTPTTTGGTVTTWSVSPSLPSGLSLASSDGAISGTPTAVSSSATYTITGTNTGGSASTTITIVVNDVVITYPSTSFTLTKGMAMSTTTPTSTGGAVVTWAVSPSPSGRFDFSRPQVPYRVHQPPSRRRQPTPSPQPTREVRIRLLSPSRSTTLLR